MEENELTIPAEPRESTPEQLGMEPETPAAQTADDQIMAILEAVVYVTDEPLTTEQIADALGEPRPRIAALLERLISEFSLPRHGLTVREVAGGFKMSTKPEHHDAIRSFVKKLQPSLKLSMAALETLAVIAYKQPVTSPEVMEIRGVQGAGVLKTLLDRKLITTAGRKNVVGRPILYKTTKDFMVQFGLKDMSELPTLKEFEELRRMAIGDEEAPAAPALAVEVGEPEPVAAGPEPAVGEESA
jgi:segregation and condensation protein B